MPGRKGPSASTWPWPPSNSLPPASPQHRPQRPQTHRTAVPGHTAHQLTAGVLGTAIRLFKVVLCFAFYPPTESTFCWVGEGREQEKKNHHGDWSVPGPKRGHAREGGGLGGQGRGTCPCPWTGWFPLCLGTSTVRGSRTPNHTLPASQPHLNCLTLPWGPRRSPNSAQRGRRSRRRGV